MQQEGIFAQTDKISKDFECLSKSKNKVTSLKMIALAGGLSGMLMESLLHPMDTIRTRLKANTQQYVSARKMLNQILKSEGPFGLYKGFTCTFSGSFISYMGYFLMYENLKLFFDIENSKHKDLIPFATAFISSIVQDIIYIPCDVVRTRMQLENTPYQYKNVVHGIRNIIKNEGYKSCYLGGPVFFTLDMLHGSFTFGFYELFSDRLKKYYKFSDSDIQNTLKISLISSSLAGGLAGFLTNPLDVMVTRFQMIDTSKEKPLKIIEVVKNIYSKEGGVGFLKGLSGRVGYYSVSSMILFTCYEFTKKILNIQTDSDQIL